MDGGGQSGRFRLMVWRRRSIVAAVADGGVLATVKHYSYDRRRSSWAAAALALLQRLSKRRKSERERKMGGRERK